MMKKVFIIVFVSFFYSNMAFGLTVQYRFSMEGYVKDDDVLESPVDIEVGSNGNIYVMDSSFHRIIVFNRNYNYLYSIGGLGDGKENFKHPSSLSIDRHGNIYVADTGNNRIQIVDHEGEFLEMVDTSSIRGSRHGYPACLPLCVFVDVSDEIYVCNTIKDEVLILNRGGKLQKVIGARSDLFDVLSDSDRANLDSEKLQKIVEGIGKEDGHFITPSSITKTDSGNIVVLDSGNYRVQVFDKEGNFIRKFGSKGRENGQFKLPVGVAMDDSENILVSDSGSNRVQVV